MNKAVPQPHLFPILDFDDDRFATCEAPRELSWDEVITKTEKWEESTAIKEFILDNVISETKNLEETAIVKQTFLVIPDTENVEETATIMRSFQKQRIWKDLP